MTVIATMMTRSGTAHATDSLLTTRGPGGKRLPVESRETKVIPVRHFRGALAYWGYAGDDSGARTVDWLRDRAAEASQHNSAEVFAADLARRAEAWLRSRGVARDPRYGLGIHFTAYERVRDYWIPELFLVSNFEDPNYSALRPGGVGYSRETFSTVSGIPRTPEDRQPEGRLRVHEFLQQGGWLRFNNGDPLLFNPTAMSLETMLELAQARGVLAEIDLTRLLHWTRLPVEMVGELQEKFYRFGVAVVGGRIHDLAITPLGEYLSSSGNAD
jgi:hypothetical protein